MMEIPLTIKDTQKALLEGKIKAVSLVDLYLSRIQKYDSKINSFITLTKEEAYKKAKKLDFVIENEGPDSLKKLPLLGVTVSYKDLFSTKGVRTTAGAKLLESYVPRYSATVVKRLEEAGAIMIGKLNMDAWAHGSSGENSDFGPTKNPWGGDFVPGGSSSGSGAALAANFSLITTGTDTCGSIRLPASYSGVYGFKPTYGAVSRYGIIAMASSLDSVGNLGRTVSDIKQVFNVTKGEDGLDATVKNGRFQKKEEKFRIGVPKEFFGKGLDSEVRQKVEEAVKIYEKIGVEVLEVALPHSPMGISVYYIVQPAEVSSNLARFDGVRFGLTRKAFSAEAKRRIMLGTYVLSAGYYDAYYLKAMKVRSKIIDEVENAFDKVDALLAPVAPTGPFKLGEKSDDPLKMYLTDIYAATANLAGLPALSIPYGFNKKGLPLGFQLMGPRFSEEMLFDLAALFEKETKYIPKVANLK